MKYLATIIFVFMSISCCFASCSKSDANNEVMSENKIKITIGTTIFTATLYDNATANAFKAMLPITINMSDLHSNEKYFYLANTLPTNAINPGTIQTGDLMLYGNNCLVLFYKSFSTSYRYTRIGKIDNVSGLATALGTGSVKVIYELAKQTTSIENLKNSQNFQIYPNPANDFVIVSGKFELLTLLNANGVAVAKTKQNMISVAKFPQGVYFLKIKAKNKEEIIHKIIKS